MDEIFLIKDEVSVNGHNDDIGCEEFNTNRDQINDQICNEDKSREPDCDSLKMFVGQIPREWSETECTKLLEPFGDIYALNVLKDKRSAKSRGCCFVTFYTRRAALEAQNALHNIRTLPTAKDLIIAAAAQVLLGTNQSASAITSNINSCGQQCNNCSIAETIIRATQQPIPCHHPIQMKPADTENRNERKLFVGMLSKTMTEQDIKNMFSSFGVIEECSILRDNTNQSKGCAFVTFTSRTSASNAIKSLNHSTTLEGCTSSLVVKFADTPKDKDQRRGKQSLMQQLWTHPSSPLSTTLVTHPYLTLAALTSAAQQQQQLAASLALQQHLTSDLSLASALTNPVFMALTGAQQTKMSPQTQQITLNPHFNSNKLDMFSGVRDQLSFAPTLSTTPSLSGVQHLSSSLNSVSNTTVNTNKQVEGPEGANLFIYHLPPEFTDNDLISTFNPFGNVISAKVFIDKNSNLSKCFGFVSYDNALSAQSAIQAMHGFQIRNKRLKVQLKKNRDKPY